MNETLANPKANSYVRTMLPNVLTIAGLCVGLSALKYALMGRFEAAVIALCVAALMDALDGRVARMLNGTSKLGAELDSFADLINFGVIPAVVMYEWLLKDMGRLGWVLVLVYIVSCTLRLARFNLQSDGALASQDLSQGEAWRAGFFTGVPSPSGGAIMILPLILSYSDLVSFTDFRSLVAIFTMLSSFLMISRIPTYSFKSIRVKKRFVVLLLLGFGLLVDSLIHRTFATLFWITAFYLLMIPVSFIRFRSLKRSQSCGKKAPKREEEVILEDFL